MSFGAPPAADALTEDGVQRFHAALGESDLAALDAAIGPLASDRPGLRLHGIVDLRPFLIASSAIGRIGAAALGPACHPVRALLFDKTETTNWSLSWHQDRTIAVQHRIETAGFSAWSIKRGVVHVEPPAALLAGMATVRVHLDPVPASNAPLLIAPGSHRFGRVPEADIATVVAHCGTVACLAERGDVWLYATPILHASEAAAAPARRRVLQVDFAVGALPGGLAWFGV